MISGAIAVHDSGDATTRDGVGLRSARRSTAQAPVTIAMPGRYASRNAGLGLRWLLPADATAAASRESC
jgi:hypothetical protein